MKENKKKLLYAFLTTLLTVLALLVVNYLAVKFCIGNLTLFTVFILVVPIIGIAVAAFIIGYLVKGNWKTGICVALILTLVSFGTGRFAVWMGGTHLENLVTDDPQNSSDEDNSKDNDSEDALKDDLYDELDKKAYQYMLENGLISEGEEIHGGEGTIDGKESGTDERASDDNDIASSEMYVGIQQSDSTTELIGNIITFLIAFGMSCAGGRLRMKREKAHIKN